MVQLFRNRINQDDENRCIEDLIHYHSRYAFKFEIRPNEIDYSGKYCGGHYQIYLTQNRLRNEALIVFFALSQVPCE